MYTVGELFDLKLLKLPKAVRADLKGIKELADALLRDAGGIYVFYNKYGEALYVGITSNIKSRVKDHLQNNKGNKDLAKYFRAGNPLSLIVYYEGNVVYQDVYETYLIHQLEPRFNIGKTGRSKING